MALKIDHVIVAVRDLDEASAGLFDRFGLASVPGGRHEGHGTANRIVPLGDDYIELMAVVDDAEAEGSPMGKWITAATSDGDHLLAVCLRTDDIDAEATARDLTAMPMTRSRPDGMVLSWRLTGLDVAIVEPPLPFFIQWDIDPAEMPGSAPAPHTSAPSGITRVVLSGDPERIGSWIGDDAVPIEIVGGEPAVTKVAIGGPTGELVFERL